MTDEILSFLLTSCLEPEKLLVINLIILRLTKNEIFHQISRVKKQPIKNAIFSAYFYPLNHLILKILNY